MKKLILIFAVVLGAISTQAQTTTTTPEKKSTETKYCCAKGDHCAKETGKCPAHEVDLIKEGDYFCNNCCTSKEYAGKCGNCGKKMKKMKCEMKEEKKEEKKEPEKK